MENLPDSIDPERFGEGSKKGVGRRKKQVFTFRDLFCSRIAVNLSQNLLFLTSGGNMADRPLNALLVEDNPVESMIIKSVLTKAVQPSFRIEAAENVQKGLKRLEGKDIDLILLDLSLPDSEGIETFDRVQKEALEVPIIVLTGLDDETLALEALRRGAQDYVVKGEADPKMLLRIIRYAIERKKVERQLREMNKKLAEDEKALVETLQTLRRSNQELRAIRLQLIQAAKMEVVGRLAAGVAHEVKNPLAMLRMGVDYFLKTVNSADEKSNFMLKSMAEAIKRADSVIKELLDFSSMQKLDMQPQKLDAIIDQSLFLVKHELDKHHIRVIKEFQDEIPLIRADRNRMEQVMINLFTNAIQAMGDQGDLRLRMNVKTLDSVGGVVGYRKDDVFTPGDTIVEIFLEDTGRGIPEEIMDKIFDPFFTTKRGEGGAGLGLSVVKSIIQMHHGAINVENKADGGVRVTIMLRVNAEIDHEGKEENSHH